MDNRPIGVFDSGLGGVTVLQELKKILPNEDFIYLGDTKHSPYGEKTKDELKKLVNNNIKFLLEKDVKVIVIACNTAASIGSNYYDKNYDIPFISVLEAGVDEVKDTDENILVAATQATINLGRYQKLIKKNHKDINVVGVACPDIVPAIEFSDLSKIDTQNIVDRYILEHSDGGFDGVILGCTHYPIFEKEFSKAIPSARLINPARRTAQMTREFLEKHNMLRLESDEYTSREEFYVSGDINIFKEKIERIFEKKIQNIDKIG